MNQRSCQHQDGPVHYVGKKEKNRGGAHDEEDNSKAATHAEKVISELVSRSCVVFGANVIRGIDSREECNRNGERQDTARVVSILSSLPETYHDEKTETHPIVRSV